MKHIVAGALALTICGGTVAVAGNGKAPAMETPIIIADTEATSSSSAIVQVALLGIVIFGAALAN